MSRVKLLAILFSFAFMYSCSDDDDVSTPNQTLNLNLSGLEDLGDDFVYEGWLIVNGAPVSTGTFTVDGNGALSQTAFSVDANNLASASTFVLSIEPANDTDPAPADTKILAGDFSGNSASVSSNGIVANFANAAGTYILATPTDMDDTTEASGVWFLDNSSEAPMAGLTLPQLSAGWVYEGWVVINGMPVSTGTFTDVMMADNNAATSPYKGTAGNGPAFPGEDLVMGSYNGINFPTDLRGATVVISVEPMPDNSPNPFTIKPLAQMVAADAMVHTAYNMGNGPVAEIMGTVTR